MFTALVEPTISLCLLFHLACDTIHVFTSAIRFVNVARFVCKVHSMHRPTVLYQLIYLLKAVGTSLTFTHHRHIFHAS